MGDTVGSVEWWQSKPGGLLGLAEALRIGHDEVEAAIEQPGSESVWLWERMGDLYAAGAGDHAAAVRERWDHARETWTAGLGALAGALETYAARWKVAEERATVVRDLLGHFGSSDDPIVAARMMVLSMGYVAQWELCEWLGREIPAYLEILDLSALADDPAAPAPPTPAPSAPAPPAPAPPVVKAPREGNMTIRTLDGKLLLCGPCGRSVDSVHRSEPAPPTCPHCSMPLDAPNMLDGRAVRFSRAVGIGDEVWTARVSWNGPSQQRAVIGRVAGFGFLGSMKVDDAYEGRVVSVGESGPLFGHQRS